ncbi:endonuclease/exonuclease/phosphatase family protein [Microbacterium lushaniae]|uniref:endonuclease/exonuclease/phosphatase family protein n=1 Tax=Microbacterium lushaniae TaxID=2614639 RepID=UPI0019310FE3|nr:endonuclease/exonuclease/phosphatase family protein [Microbacterium lushaniae]
MPDNDALIGPVPAPQLSVMTFNVLRARKGSAGWLRRRDSMRALLRREQPTILGAQEVLPHQADVVRDALGASYRFVGRGRDADGGGEGCPVFWDDARLELVDWDQRALSARPDVAGSRSWGTLFPRILTRVQFTDRATGARLLMINTHLDVLSPLARARSAAILADNAGDGAALITGDFNAGPESAPRRRLDAAGFADTWALASTHLTREWGTYASRRRPRSGGTRIDAIHARGFDVVSAGIGARPVRGGRASDHLPVQVVVRMRGAVA